MTERRLSREGRDSQPGTPRRSSEEQHPRERTSEERLYLNTRNYRTDNTSSDITNTSETAEERIQRLRLEGAFRGFGSNVDPLVQQERPQIADSQNLSEEAQRILDERRKQGLFGGFGRGSSEFYTSRNRADTSEFALFPRMSSEQIERLTNLRAQGDFDLGSGASDRSVRPERTFEEEHDHLNQQFRQETIRMTPYTIQLVRDYPDLNDRLNEAFYAVTDADRAIVQNNVTTLANLNNAVRTYARIARTVRNEIDEPPNYPDRQEPPGYDGNQ